MGELARVAIGWLRPPLAQALVLAALIVGASLLTGVETDFRILGYPGPAIVLFLLAELGDAHLL